MLKTFSLCFVLNLVAANPVLQRIPIPGQTCPAACPTCPSQTCSNMSRPAPCQTCQNPYRNVFNPLHAIAQQPSNSCPYNTPVTVQSSIANPPLNQEALSQLIRFFNPQPQMQVVNPIAPVKTCNQCEAQKPVPNIINNYIIIPPEYFKANQSNSTEDTVNKRRKGRRRKQSRERNLENEPSCTCDGESENLNDKVINEEHVIPCPCEKEVLSKAIDAAEVLNDEVRYASKDKIKTGNDIVLHESTTTGIENTETSQNNTIKENHREVEPLKTTYTESNPAKANKPKRKNRERTKSIEEAIIKDFCAINPTIPEEIARLLLKNLKQKVESQASLHYDPYPYSTHSYSDYNPYPQMFPLMYPRNEDRRRVNNYRSQNNRGSRRRKPHRAGRRNKKQKEETKENEENCDQKCEKILALNPTVINIETETITTEKITATTENKPKNNLPINKSETQVETPDDLIDKLEQMKEKLVKLNEIETTTVNYNKHIESYPELGKEDKVPTVYDNGVDDYYPDFRGDNIAFYTSEEERDINEDRYHYTTDKNGGLDCKRYVTPKQSNTDTKIFAISNSNKDESSQYTLPIQNESDESYEESINDEIEEIRFRIPPHLELPDFETKQINKLTKEINDEFVADDFNTVTYSDAKARMPEIEMKPAKVFTKDKTGRMNIETVFGHSRVVKYGQDTEGAGSDPVITYYLPEEAMTEDRIQLPDSEKAVVVAKSIHDLVEDWEY